MALGQPRVYHPNPAKCRPLDIGGRCPMERSFAPCVLYCNGSVSYPQQPQVCERINSSAKSPRSEGDRRGELELVTR